MALKSKKLKIKKKHTHTQRILAFQPLRIKSGGKNLYLDARSPNKSFTEGHWHCLAVNQSLWSGGIMMVSGLGLMLHP